MPSWFPHRPASAAVLAVGRYRTGEALGSGVRESRVGEALAEQPARASATVVVTPSGQLAVVSDFCCVDRRCLLLDVVQMRARPPPKRGPAQPDTRTYVAAAEKLRTRDSNLSPPSAV
jgi:hypothetical protein